MAEADAQGFSSLLTEAPAAIATETHLLQKLSVGHHVKLPPFSKTNPASWFHRAEVHFRVAKLTDEYAKADIVMTTLPEEVFTKLTPWLDTMDGQISYQEIKKKILDTYSLPIPVRAQKVLDLVHQPLGDTTPTEAWDELQGLILLPGTDTGGRRQEISLSREIFLRRLPADIRAQLMEAHTMEMEELVYRAQRLFEAAKASNHAATPSTNAVGHDPTDEEYINYVKKKWAIPKKKPNNYTPPSQNPASHNQTNPNPSWCFYHQKFGKRAYNCRAPCSYPKN